MCVRPIPKKAKHADKFNSEWQMSHCPFVRESSILWCFSQLTQSTSGKVQIFIAGVWYKRYIAWTWQKKCSETEREPLSYEQIKFQIVVFLNTRNLNALKWLKTGTICVPRHGKFISEVSLALRSKTFEICNRKHITTWGWAGETEVS